MLLSAKTRSRSNNDFPSRVSISSLVTFFFSFSFASRTFTRISFGPCVDHTPTSCNVPSLHYTTFLSSSNCLFTSLRCHSKWRITAIGVDGNSISRSVFFYFGIRKISTQSAEYKFGMFFFSRSLLFFQTIVRVSSSACLIFPFCSSRYMNFHLSPLPLLRICKCLVGAANGDIAATIYENSRYSVTRRVYNYRRSRAAFDRSRQRGCLLWKIRCDS